MTNLRADPAVGAMVSNVRDITERKLAEAALQESERLYQEAQEIAHLGSWSAGADAEQPIQWSRECARIFGRIGQHGPTPAAFLQMVDPDDRARVSDAIERAASQGVPCETEHRIVRATGEVRWVYSRSSPTGQPHRVVGVIQDITERKRVQDELRVSDLRYRRIVEHTSEGVWMYDRRGLTTFMNARMAEMLEITVDDGRGRSIYGFMHEADVDAARARIARRQQGVSERGEIRLRRAGGTDLWVTMHADPLFDADGVFEGSLALLSDIGDRRRGDEARMLLASIVESSGDAIISRGLDGKIRTWNRGAEALTLYTAAEAIGQPISMLYEDQARVDAGAPLEQLEMVAVRKDGTRVDIALSSSLLADEHGQITGVSIIARDISERKRTETELRRTEEQLRQAQKMEAIGSLAGGVAHDFNNLLSVILSYSEMMIEDLQPENPMRQDLGEVLDAGRRAMGLTRQLLAFSRKQLLEPVVMNLDEVIGGIEKMLRRLLGEDIDLTLVLASRPARLHADPGQIEQVIMNLVVNARDAMPMGGGLTIETCVATLDADDADATPGVIPGDYVLLVVTDTGIGMDAATLERVFEPFFTTKDKSKGTGLGLSTVYGIIQQTGGHISVASTVNRGTTFNVYLPRTDRHAAAEARPSAHRAAHRGAETILLVEDEPAVRALMRTVLRKGGYQVLEAENAGDAFLLCEQFTETIHLLLTDVVMPRMGGRQLAERLVVQRPDMKVLFVSGYTEDTIVRHGVLEAGIEFLAKPITADVLLRKVRQVLDGRAKRPSAIP